MNSSVSTSHYPIDLDALPRGWVAGAIGEFIDDIRPGFPSGAHNKTGDGIAHLRPMNITRSGSIDLSNVKYVADDNRQKVQSGDILFNNTNSPELVGKTAVIPSGVVAAYSNHMTRLRPPMDLDSTFVALQLHFLWMSGYFLHHCVNHVNQASISSKTLARMVPLVIPPLAEQRRIVVEIETQFTRLDAAVAALQRGRENLKRYRAAVLEETFKGPLVPLSGVLDAPLANGRSVPDKPGGFPVLRLTALKNGWIDLEEFKEGAWTPDQAKSFIVVDNDFLVARGNGSLALVGRGGLVRGAQRKIAFPDTMIRIRCDHSKVLPEYMRLVWNAPAMRKQIESTARTTAGIYKISQRDIAKFQIPVPTLAQQARIVDEVEDRLSVIEQVQAMVDEDLQRAERLRQSILRKALAGELVPQDPDDEPTSVLLSR